MNTPPSQRVKAVRLRGKVKAGAPLSPEEAAWLNDYDTKQDERKNGDMGASSARRVSYTEEETKAVGYGSAAEVAAAAALSREEGRRYDHLLDGAIRALTAACKMHEDMSKTLLDRAKEDGQTVRELLVSVRTHFLEKTELEADAIRAAAEAEGNDSLGKLAEQLLPILAPMMGIPVAQVPTGNGRKKQA